MNKWHIDKILHSGRKGIRFESCNDSKYKYVIDQDVYFNEDDIQRAKELRMNFKHHPFYDWWDTSLVLACWRDEKSEKLYIETENTIYVLSKVRDRNEI